MKSLPKSTRPTTHSTQSAAMTFDYFLMARRIKTPSVHQWCNDRCSAKSARHLIRDQTGLESFSYFTFFDSSRRVTLIWGGKVIPGRVWFSKRTRFAPMACPKIPIKTAQCDDGRDSFAVPFQCPSRCTMGLELASGWPKHNIYYHYEYRGLTL